MARFIVGSAEHHCTHPTGEHWDGLIINPSPRVHATKKSAMDEAARLALEYPDKSFIVFLAFNITRINPNPRPVVVQEI